MGPRFFKRGEPGDNAKRIEMNTKASMGPRFFKRGEQALDVTTCNSYSGFNGATLFQAWREYVFGVVYGVR